MFEIQYLGYEEKASAEQSVSFEKAVLVRKMFFVSVTAGAAFLSSSLIYAQGDSNEQATVLPKLIIEGENAKKPVYSGTDGQVLETNHAGFLGSKDALDTPFSAISYTDKFIEDQQAQDVTDIISATDASVHSSHTSGESRESYSIRGFTSNSNDVTVNGLAGMAPFYRSATEMYERAEVLKGPSAMLNGMAPNGSIGGSVNLVTKRAGDEPLTRLTSKYISDSQLGGHLDVGRRYGKHKQFGVRFNGAYLNGGSTVDSRENESKLGSLALDWRGERLRLSADFYHTEEQVDGPTRGVSVATDVRIPSVPDLDTALNPSWAYFNSKTKGAITRGEFDVNDQLTIYASVGETKWNYEGLSADKAEISNAAGDMETTLGHVRDDNKRTSMELGLNGHFQTASVNHQIAANLTRYEEDYRLNAKRLSGTYSTNIYNTVWGSRPDIDAQAVSAVSETTTKTTLSSYGLADTLSFAEDKYQLTLGARYQQVKTKNTGYMSRGPRTLPVNDKYDKSVITPSAALLVKLTDNLSAYANYIEGLSKGATAPADADNVGKIFSPYKTKQKELGFKLDLGDFTHTVSIFEIERPTSYTDTDTNIFGYYGEQRNRGVEWGFFGSPVDNVRLMGGLTFLDAEITSAEESSQVGNQASGVSDWEAKLGTEWDTPYIQNLTLTAKANMVSEQYLGNDNAQSLPGYTIFGLGARYTTAINTMPLTIRANIDNVLDKATWTTASYKALALVKGRTLKLSAAVEF